MNYINWNNPPEDISGISFKDLRRLYGILWKMLQECKRMKGATESVLSKATKGERAAKKEARHLKHDMIQMTKKQKARDELKACGAWSGAAIGICTLTWQGFEEYGAPFPQFMVESEWFFGSVCWIVTLIFGWVAKAFHGVD